MNILALDTATEVSSVAVFNGEKTFSVESDSGAQSRSLLETVEQQLAQASLKLNEINLIVFDKGPGSFTGMRIATGVAQGLGYGLSVPVVGISSLLSMAYATGAQRAAVAIDARMAEIYFGCYKRNDNGSMSALCGERVLSPEAATLPASTEETIWSTAGTGWSVYDNELRSANPSAIFENSTIVCPTADTLIELALSQGDKTNIASLALPSYIRNDVAKKSSKN